MKRTDVVVVGGSLAGSACAIELVRRGIDAVVFERDRFPRPKVCGAFLSPGALGALDSMDLLGEVRAVGARQIEGVRLTLGERRIEVRLPEAGLGVSRSRLDPILARAAGVREETSVERIDSSWDGRRFVVTVRTRWGAAERFSCRAVVDASGRRSRFTPGVAGPWFGVQRTEPGEEGGRLGFGFFEWGYGGTVAVEDGQVNACYLVDRASVGRFRARGFRVTGGVGCVSKAGPWIAVGDAAGMVDPFTGEGIRHALESGQTAGRAIARGFGTRGDYASMRSGFQIENEERWGPARRRGARLRWMIGHTGVGRLAFSAMGVPGVAAAVLRRVWRVD